MNSPDALPVVHCTACGKPCPGWLDPGALVPGKRAGWKCRHCKTRVVITGA